MSLAERKHTLLDSRLRV